MWSDIWCGGAAFGAPLVLPGMLQPPPATQLLGVLLPQPMFESAQSQLSQLLTLTSSTPGGAGALPPAMLGRIQALHAALSTHYVALRAGPRGAGVLPFPPLPPVLCIMPEQRAAAMQQAMHLQQQQCMMQQLWVQQQQQQQQLPLPLQAAAATHCAVPPLRRATTALVTAPAGSDEARQGHVRERILSARRTASEKSAAARSSRLAEREATIAAGGVAAAAAAAAIELEAARIRGGG